MHFRELNIHLPKKNNEQKLPEFWLTTDETQDILAVT
jgi:hypothetical protein